MLRIFLIAAVLATGCGKKPAPQTPANKAADADKDKGSTDNAKPDPGDTGDPKKSDDPCAM